MNKKAMSLVTLVITIIIMIILAGAIIINLSNSGIIEKANQAVTDMDLKNLEQLANMAYADIYFENLTKGIRRELTAEEIRLRMIKDGADEQKMSLYEVIVEDGDVFVTLKEEE